MEENLIDELKLEKVVPSIIMVAGVGGAGGNAVTHMCDRGIDKVKFMVCNTDKQALKLCPPEIVKMQLGEGLGAGNNPEKGREAALDSLEEIVAVFEREGTRMVFVTAGMGGGTGTGAAPVIARAAREQGILTVGIVTMPYKSEGPKRVSNAHKGIEELKKCVDSLLIINNENIQEIYGELPLTEAFGRANDVLGTAAKGIADIITKSGVVNVDFADVNAVMRNSGIALMGSGIATGVDRAKEAVELALSSPLLNHNSIDGAKNILINITYGTKEITLNESTVVTEYIQAMAGDKSDVIWGAVKSDTLTDEVEVTVIATGFAIEEDNVRRDIPIFSIVPQGTERVGMVKAPFDNGVVESKSEIKAKLYSDSNNIIRFNDDRKRYNNIDKIIQEPAYVRRRVNLSKDIISEDSKRSVTRLKSSDLDHANAVKDETVNLLFDQK